MAEILCKTCKKLEKNKCVIHGRYVDGVTKCSEYDKKNEKQIKQEKEEEKKKAPELKK